MPQAGARGAYLRRRLVVAGLGGGHRGRLLKVRTPRRRQAPGAGAGQFFERDGGKAKFFEDHAPTRPAVCGGGGRRRSGALDLERATGWTEVENDRQSA